MNKIETVKSLGDTELGRSQVHRKYPTTGEQSMDNSIMDEMESLTNNDTTSAETATTQRPSAPSPFGTVQKIVKDCGLADVLGQSVCLHCASRVLAMDSKKRATLYCSALFRDLEVEITECTAYTPEMEGAQK